MGQSIRHGAARTCDGLDTFNIENGQIVGIHFIAYEKSVAGHLDLIKLPLKIMLEISAILRI